MKIYCILTAVLCAALMLSSCGDEDSSGSAAVSSETAATTTTASVTTTTAATEAVPAEASLPPEDPEPISLEGAVIAFDTKDAKYTYTGEAVAPAFTVTVDGEQLAPDTDFTAEFENNTEVGTANLRLTGTDRYTGTAETTFEITHCPLDGADVKLGALAYAYTGYGIIPQTAVTLNGRALEINKDYAVTCADNTAVGDNTAKLTVTGIGNYSGQKALTFSIVKRDISGGAIQLPAIVYTYNNAPVEPTVGFIIGGVTLRRDTDFTVEYKNNNAPGTGTVTVTGIGNYTGTKSINIVINKPYVPPAPQKTNAEGYHVDDNGELTPEAADFKKRLEAFVESVTAGQDDKLRACFDAISKFPYAKNYIYRGESGWEMSCADQMLKYKCGVCYSYASLFMFCARYLGYDIHCAHNQIRTVHRRTTTHCWTELTLDGVTYICDPESWWEVQKGNISKSFRCDFYMLEYENVPYPMSYHPESE